MTPEYDMTDGTNSPDWPPRGNDGGSSDNEEGTLPPPDAGDGPPDSGPDNSDDESGGKSDGPDGVEGRTRGDEPKRPGGAENAGALKSAGSAEGDGAESSEETFADAFDEESIEEIKKKFSAQYAGIVRNEDLETLLDKNKEPDEVLEAAKNAGLTYETLMVILETTGHGKETTNLITQHQNGLIKTPEGPPSDDEQELSEEIRKTQSATAKIQGLDFDPAKREEAEAVIEEGERQVGRIFALVGRIRKKLSTDPDGGIFRPEDFAKRVIAKPLFTILLTAAVLYAMLLHVGTKWATKRLGSG